MQEQYRLREARILRKENMIYIFLADGFEEIEALTPLDILRRAGLEAITVGIDKKIITGAHGISVVCDTDTRAFTPTQCDMVILPGGMPGTNNLNASRTVHQALDIASKDGAYIAAICAAPIILGDRGELNGKNAVCYPGFENRLSGATVVDRGVCVDGKIITARGMGVATEFALTLLSLLLGEDSARKIAKQIMKEDN